MVGKLAEQCEFVDYLPSYGIFNGARSFIECEEMLDAVFK